MLFQAGEHVFQVFQYEELQEGTPVEFLALDIAYTVASLVQAITIDCMRLCCRFKARTVFFKTCRQGYVQTTINVYGSFLIKDESIEEDVLGDAEEGAVGEEGVPGGAGRAGVELLQAGPGQPLSQEPSHEYLERKVKS